MIKTIENNVVLIGDENKIFSEIATAFKAYCEKYNKEITHELAVFLSAILSGEEAIKKGKINPPRI